MRAVLINLDRSQDRLALMTHEFSGAGLAFDRFSAVDGTNLPGSIRPYFCDSSGKVISPLRAGEIGCYASHLATWQRIAAGDYGLSALVCEDDMRLPTGFAALMTALLAVAPAGWDLIRLSPHTKRAVVPICQIAGEYCLVHYTRQPVSAAAYLVSQDGARKLLVPAIRVRPVDQDFRRPWTFGLNSFGVWPAIAEDPGISSVIDGMGGRFRTTRRSSRWAINDVLLRPLYGIRTLGFRQWLKCATWNAIGRKIAPTPPVTSFDRGMHAEHGLLR
jgi:glycosyl transferase, family 25